MTTGGYVQSYAVDHLHLDPTRILISVMVAAAGWLVNTLAGGRANPFVAGTAGAQRFIRVIETVLRGRIAADAEAVPA
jgi:hypothetical protein